MSRAPNSGCVLHFPLGAPNPEGPSLMDFERPIQIPLPSPGPIPGLAETADHIPEEVRGAGSEMPRHLGPWAAGWKGKRPFDNSDRFGKGSMAHPPDSEDGCLSKWRFPVTNSSMRCAMQHAFSQAISISKLSNAHHRVNHPSTKALVPSGMAPR